nr:hypothetical protein [Brucella intermedia]
MPSKERQELIETIAQKMQEKWSGGHINWDRLHGQLKKDYLDIAEVAADTIRAALKEPTEGMTSSVRHIMMWLGETRPTEKSLMDMCERRGVEPPDGCGAFDHVPSKAAQSYWIWQEMLAASALGEQSE